MALYALLLPAPARMPPSVSEILVRPRPIRAVLRFVLLVPLIIHLTAPVRAAVLANIAAVQAPLAAAQPSAVPTMVLTPRSGGIAIGIPILPAFTAAPVPGTAAARRPRFIPMAVTEQGAAVLS